MSPDTAHAAPQGRAAQRVNHRAHHRTRPGARRDPPRLGLRGTPEAEAAPQLRQVGEALEVRLQGPRGRRAGADRPHDLPARRPGHQGVPRYLSGHQVHDHARLFACHRRQRQALPDGPPRSAALPAAVHTGRRRQRVHGPIRGRLRATAHPPARPAAAAPAVQRLRRTGQSLRQDRIEGTSTTAPSPSPRSPAAWPATNSSTATSAPTHRSLTKPQTNILSLWRPPSPRYQRQ